MQLLLVKAVYKQPLNVSVGGGGTLLNIPVEFFTVSF